MDRKRLLIIAGAVLIVLLVVALFFVLRESGPGDGVGDLPDLGEDGPPEWKGAPDPAVDLEKLDEYRRLWPDIDRPRPDREEIRREFAEFAARYPNNIYIPPQFLPEQTEAQKEEARQIIDTVADVESRLAVQRAQARSAQPGQDGPNAPEQPTISAEEQNRYFGFKIRELESRIQLVEYSIEKGRLPDDQREMADEDLARWKKELEDLRNVAGQIPR